MHTAIVWFRRDLRLADNPALTAACEQAERLLPIFILETDTDDWAPGAASRWWLHHSLRALDAALRERGSRLHLLHGEAGVLITELAEAVGAAAVHWNRRLEPDAIRRDKEVKSALSDAGILCRSHNAALLAEPWEAVNKQGRPYKVFTPFWRNLQPRLETLAPGPDAASSLPPPPRGRGRSLTLNQLALRPRIRWDAGLEASWQPGEAGARARLAAFLDNDLQAYPGRRDYPGEAATSRLSPHLHFGEIGPRQVLGAVRDATGAHRQAGLYQAGEAFVRELAWREFGHHLLYYFPHTPDHSLDERFEAFPWADTRHLPAWQRGRTGIPIVDAGLRELWHTGWMHNRVRMVAASFLTKNLRIHWHEGARWFWDTLVDADLANNTLGWQWTAGCGADAAPYFRIFNPVTQAERFDPEGRYLRRWLPELAALPDKWLRQPWAAPQTVLEDAGVVLGESYPHPLVDLKASRQAALAAWETIKA